MKSEKSSSEANSGTTSASAPESWADLSEAQFLQKQQELAKQAIERTWAQITSGLKEGADPIEWARQYPWAAVGVAAVAGFAATTTLVPSKRQQALRQLAELQRAVNPSLADVVAEASSDKGHAEKKGWLATILVDAMKTLQPVLVSAITAKVSKAQAQNGYDRGTGEVPPEPPPL
jgi:hypothetical protein